MEADLINAYIDVLNDAVASLTKDKLALQAHLKVAEMKIAALEGEKISKKKLAKENVNVDEKQ